MGDRQPGTVEKGSEQSGDANDGAVSAPPVSRLSVGDGASVIRDVQTYGVPAGSGAIVEFRIPEPGMYGLVDHDRLAYLPVRDGHPVCHTGSRREPHEVNAIRRRRPSPPDVYSTSRGRGCNSAQMAETGR